MGWGGCRTAGGDPPGGAVLLRGSGLAAGERHRQTGRHKTAIRNQRQFRRPNKQNPIGREEAIQFPERPGLRNAVEIDQQIAAENKIEGCAIGKKIRLQQIPTMELDAVLHLAVELPTGCDRGKVAVAKLQRLTAKRIFPILGLLRALQGAGTKIHRVNVEARARHAGVEQRHRERVGFFASRAGDAEDSHGFAQV